MCKEKVNRWWVKARHLGRDAIVTVTRRHSSSRGSVQYYFLLFKYNFIHLITIEMFTVICGKQYFFMTSTKILFRYDISLSANVTSYKILSCLYQQYYRVFLFLRYESSTLILYKELSITIFQSCESVSQALVTPFQISTLCNIYRHECPLLTHYHQLPTATAS